MKNSEKKFKYIDLRDAADNLALSQHHLVMELLKLGSMICIRFDDISSRMVKIVPPKSHQKFIDYRINPGDIHCLTLDSSKRIERMLKKSELVFEGLRLEIDFADIHSIGLTLSLTGNFNDLSVKCSSIFLIDPL